MDFKDCLVFKTKSDKGRVAIPKSAIKGIFSKEETDYSTNSKIEITHLIITATVAEVLGVPMKYLDKSDTLYNYPIGDKFEVALGFLRGDKGAETLFSNE